LIAENIQVGLSVLGGEKTRMSSAPNDELSELLHSSHFTSKFTNGSIAPAILRRPTIDHALLMLVILVVQIEESRGKYDEEDVVMELNGRIVLL
jgi:hypothetical protein